MTQGQRNALLRRSRSLGYEGNNLGQASAVAASIVNGTSVYSWSARQRRTAADINSATTGSG